MEALVTVNDEREKQSEIPVKITAVEVAWWLSTGEADPTLESRFMYGTPDDAMRREHIATQVNRLIVAAEAAGISDTLMAVLADLCRQSSAGPAVS